MLSLYILFAVCIPLIGIIMSIFSIKCFAEYKHPYLVSIIILIITCVFTVFPIIGIATHNTEIVDEQDCIIIQKDINKSNIATVLVQAEDDTLYTIHISMEDMLHTKLSDKITIQIIKESSRWGNEYKLLTTWPNSNKKYNVATMTQQEVPSENN